MGLKTSKKFPFRQIRKIKQKTKYLYRRYILRDVFKAEVRRWQEDDGDRTLRLSYDLNKQSVVFDLGGYIGDFASQIYNKHGSNVYLFEPSKPFFEKSRARFGRNDKVRSFNFGLSDTNGQFSLSDEADGSSLKNDTGTGETVFVRRFKDVFDELKIERIDLLKINIEGGEYDVIPHLIDTGLIERVNHIQVQFHNFIPGAAEKRDAIVKALQRTHTRDWCYIFVWESWSLK